MKLTANQLKLYISVYISIYTHIGQASQQCFLFCGVCVCALHICHIELNCALSFAVDKEIIQVNWSVIQKSIRTVQGIFQRKLHGKLLRKGIIMRNTCLKWWKIYKLKLEIEWEKKKNGKNIINNINYWNIFNIIFIMHCQQLFLSGKIICC